MATIKIDDLQSTILTELEQYSQDIADQMKKDVKTVSKECVKEIQEKSPENTGEYKKGWTFKVVHENKGNIRVKVYNSKKPGLAHLLEFGHAKRAGGRVEGTSHIEPAEQNAAKKLEGKVKVAIKR